VILHTLTYKRWAEARIVFRGYAMRLPHGQHVHFDHYVGITFPNGYHHNQTKWGIHPKIIQRIDALMGPHGHAVFRAWVAQHQPTEIRD
jgi:hypothetical protein